MNWKTLHVIFPALFICSFCKAQSLSGVQSVDLTAAGATFSEKQLTVDNMRITSSSTSPNDYVRGTFKFKKGTQSFVPKKYDIFPNVGIYHPGTSNDDYFVKDVAAPVTMVDQAGSVYQENQSYTITTAGQPYMINLLVGHVLSFNYENSSDDLRVLLRAPDGSETYNELIGAGSGIIAGTIPILQPGAYSLTFTPQHANRVSLDLRFGNANRQSLVAVGDGDFIQTNLRSNLRDYYKYRIHLNTGDRLHVDQPDDDNGHLVLLNSESVKIADNTHLGILYISKTNEDYYLFVDDIRAFGGDYSGGVQISSGVGSAASHPEETRATSNRSSSSRH